MGKREVVALLKLSSWCLVMVERLFLAVPQGCLRFVIVVFPDHTHLLYSIENTGYLSVNAKVFKRTNIVSSFITGMIENESRHLLKCGKLYVMFINICGTWHLMR